MKLVLFLVFICFTCVSSLPALNLWWFQATEQYDPSFTGGSDGGDWTTIISSTPPDALVYNDIQDWILVTFQNVAANISNPMGNYTVIVNQQPFEVFNDSTSLQFWVCNYVSLMGDCTMRYMNFGGSGLVQGLTLSETETASTAAQLCLDTGPYNLSLRYNSSTSNYSSTTSNVLSFTITKAPVTFAFVEGMLTWPYNIPNQLQFELITAYGCKCPTGNISLTMSNGTAISTAVVPCTVDSTFYLPSYTFTGANTTLLTVNYSGDVNYAPSTFSQSINIVTSVVIPLITSPVTAGVYSNSITFTVTAIVNATSIYQMLFRVKASNGSVVLSIVIAYTNQTYSLTFNPLTNITQFASFATVLAVANLYTNPLLPYGNYTVMFEMGNSQYSIGIASLAVGFTIIPVTTTTTTAAPTTTTTLAPTTTQLVTTTTPAPTLASSSSSLPLGDNTFYLVLGLCLGIPMLLIGAYLLHKYTKQRKYARVKFSRLA